MNRRPPACKAGALPAELRPHSFQKVLNLVIKAVNNQSNAGIKAKMVGLGRLELPTSRLSGVRSNHLSYRPSFYI